jgi:hypothetical protein
VESLIQAVTVVHGDAYLAVGASAGAVPLAAGATPAQVLDAADRVMYARKRARAIASALSSPAEAGDPVIAGAARLSLQGGYCTPRFRGA